MQILAFLPRPRQLLLLALAALLGTGGIAAAASTFTQLYQFQGLSDGNGPVGRLIRDANGALYGTTGAGGANSRGTVFKLAPPATPGDAWTHTVLYDFCSQSGCTDGAAPLAGVIMDAAGNLYGTTSAGGNGARAGVVFQLTPNADNTAYTETVLYTFCPTGNCPDGNRPQAELIMDAAGNLYGTTVSGGSGSGLRGVAFQLSPDATLTAWTETAVWQFCQLANCIDGAGPNGSLIMDAAGNLYGTTGGGGTGNKGVAYQLTPNAAHTAFTEKVLYSFCSQSDCTDGAAFGPGGALAMDAQGNLYGTTSNGGIGSGGGNGVVFQLTPNAAGTAYTETVLYALCQLSNCTDGATPRGSVVIDRAGNLYGPESGGGGSNGGIFRLAPNATRTAWSESVLYTFCQLPDCADGGDAQDGLLIDAAGNLFGTTATGGNGGNGTVFELRHRRHRRG